MIYPFCYGYAILFIERWSAVDILWIFRFCTALELIPLEEFRSPTFGQDRTGRTRGAGICPSKNGRAWVVSLIRGCHPWRFVQMEVMAVRLCCWSMDAIAAQCDPHLCKDFSRRGEKVRGVACYHWSRNPKRTIRPLCRSSSHSGQFAGEGSFYSTSPSMLFDQYGVPVTRIWFFIQEMVLRCRSTGWNQSPRERIRWRSPAI